MLFAVPRLMNAEERELTFGAICKSFRQYLQTEVNSVLAGGQTVINPWLLVGGACTSICRRTNIVRMGFISEGDVFVITKPLGLWTASIAHQHIKNGQILGNFSANEISEMYEKAKCYLSKLNKAAASLLTKYNCHGAVPVKYEGLIHAGGELLRINTEKSLSDDAEISKFLEIPNVDSGCSPEPSGGLLISMPPYQANEFCKELQNKFNAPSWIIGYVAVNVDDYSDIDPVRISKDVTIINVD
ncbi:hypothetical protein GJ496_004198 [Pomphorhynchus laevis]|nr:hypothetical protein GJ496_004198 [Pomphorhynchus laevis]